MKLLLILAAIMLSLTGCDKAANNALGKSTYTKPQCIYLIDGEISNEVKGMIFIEGSVKIHLIDGTTIITGASRAEKRCK